MEARSAVAEAIDRDCFAFYLLSGMIVGREKLVVNRFKSVGVTIVVNAKMHYMEDMEAENL
jgi:hypothetical protein